MTQLCATGMPRTVFLKIWRYDAAYRESNISIVPYDDDQPNFYLTMMDLYGREECIPKRFKPTDPVKFSLERFRGQMLPRLVLQRKQKIDQKRKPITEDKSEERGEEG